LSLRFISLIGYLIHSVLGEAYGEIMTALK